jgi:hypothetical protein
MTDAHESYRRQTAGQLSEQALGTGVCRRLKQELEMRLTMRAVVVVIVGSILSILAIKYANNDFQKSVPMMDPNVAAQVSS